MPLPVSLGEARKGHGQDNRSVVRDDNTLVNTGMNQGNKIVINKKMILNKCDGRMKKTSILYCTDVKKTPHITNTIVGEKSLNKTG